MQKVALLVTCVVAIIPLASMSPAETVSLNPQHYSQNEVRRLIKTARDPQDYENLATYFRYRELLYRVKAQAAMSDFAQCAPNVTLVPKFKTRADSDQEAFAYYSFKADQSLVRAERYESILLSRGLKLTRTVMRTVSLNSLERESNGSPPPTTVFSNKPK